MGGVDRIIVKEKAIKEVEESLGEAIGLEYAEDPLMSDAGEGSLKIP